MNSEILIPHSMPEPVIRWLNSSFLAELKFMIVSQGVHCAKTETNTAITITERMENRDLLSVYFARSTKSSDELAEEASLFLKTKIYISDTSLDPFSFIEVDGCTRRKVSIDWSAKK